jgi:acyl-coenzyme A thioesterase PaaI-like protein
MSSPEVLCASLRRVIRAARSTTAPPDVLAQADRLAGQLAALLEPHEHPGPYNQAALGEHPMATPDAPPARVDDPASVFPYSPIIGPRNPISPPIAFEVKGGSIQAEASFAPQYTGPPGSVHGGVIAMVLDELLGYVNLVNQTGGYTGMLTVRYRSLTPIGRPIRMEAHQQRTDGRKLYTRGSLHHGDTLTAEAEGLFIRPQRAGA